MLILLKDLASGDIAKCVLRRLINQLFKVIISMLGNFFMKTLLSCLVSGSILLLNSLPVAANDSSDGLKSTRNCENKSFSASDVEKCLERNEAASAVQRMKFPAAPVSSEMTPVQYLLRDEGRYVDAAIASDGEWLRIWNLPVCKGFSVCVNQKVIKISDIHKSRIYKYNQGLMGNSNTAAAAMPGIAVTAVIMPILVPFQALATSRNTRVYSYNLVSFNEEGALEVHDFVATSLIPVAPRFEQLLPALTGLKNGETRKKSEIVGFANEGISLLKQKLDSDRSLIVSVNKKKPWCETSMADKYPLVYKRYSANLASVNQLRQLLDEPQFSNQVVNLNSADSGQLWHEHLQANPGLKIWAEANPGPAGKLKQCAE